MSIPQNTVVSSDRDLRQRDIIPPQKLAACGAVVIGVGAVGRQVALQLAATGVLHLELVDDDTVGVENLAPQAYKQADVGQLKVACTAEDCQRLNHDLTPSIYPVRFSRSFAKRSAAFTTAAGGGQKLAVFCCVDSIGDRRQIWETVKSRCHFFVDGRLSAEVIRVLASGHPIADEHYATTLFGPEQAYRGSCTAKSTVYSASVAAGLMLTQFTRWLRDLQVDRDLCLNLLAGELACR